MMSGDAQVHIAGADAVMFGVRHGNKERKNSQHKTISPTEQALISE